MYTKLKLKPNIKNAKLKYEEIKNPTIKKQKINKFHSKD